MYQYITFRGKMQWLKVRICVLCGYKNRRTFYAMCGGTVFC